jgi:hypothetical protein
MTDANQNLINFGADIQYQKSISSFNEQTATTRPWAYLTGLVYFNVNELHTNESNTGFSITHA